LPISAVAFGLNHYYFGIRNVALKTFSGLIWGAMYLLIASLLISFVSHLAFECLVRKRMRK
ncbi:CPBP family intramembrane metalloprotease, partial [Dehalococcoidia bacterium]|nr:CPBP family intramembrane metalloprotease [Dehalococcoidia bacterium]